MFFILLCTAKLPSLQLDPDCAHASCLGGSMRTPLPSDASRTRLNMSSSYGRKIPVFVVYFIVWLVSECPFYLLIILLLLQIAFLLTRDLLPLHIVRSYDALCYINFTDLPLSDRSLRILSLVMLKPAWLPTSRPVTWPLSTPWILCDMLTGKSSHAWDWPFVLGAWTLMWGECGVRNGKIAPTVKQWM